MTSRRLSLMALALLLAMSSLPLSGCGSIKKLTGQRNDTVLPGQREEILSPEQTKAQDPDVLTKEAAKPADGSDATPCDPAIQDCSTAVDQEAGGY